MDPQSNPIYSGFSLGRWFETNVRISLFFVLFPLVLCYRLGTQLGLIVSLILFVSTLIHEFAHILVGRWSGGHGDEILMWPLGGLAFVVPGRSFFSEFWTVAAGPSSNAILCLLTLPVVLSQGMLQECCRLVYLPPVSLTSSTILVDLVLLTFSLNFKGLLLNLLPVFPLDGFGMTHAVTRLYWDRQVAKTGTLWAGLVVCVLVLMVGLAVDSTVIVFLGAILTIMGMHEFTKDQLARQFGDVYDSGFEEGYASSYEDEESKLGPLARWKQRRAEKKQAKLRQQKLETERQVDALLEKVHKEGIDALSDSERRFLEQASGKYRSQ